MHKHTHTHMLSRLQLECEVVGRKNKSVVIKSRWADPGELWEFTQEFGSAKDPDV